MNNLCSHAPGIVIDEEQADAACRLAATVGRAARIKEQLPIMLLIIGNVAMTKYHYARIRKFPPGVTSVMSGIPKNMYDADLTIPHSNFALDRQLQHHLFALNIALYRHNGRYRLQFRNHLQN